MRPKLPLMVRASALHQQRLAEAGHALEQHVAAGEQRAQHRVDHLGLADERLADLGAHRGGDLRRLGELFGGGFAVSLFAPFFECAVHALRVLRSWMKSAPRIAPAALMNLAASSLEFWIRTDRRVARSAAEAAAKSGCARATRRSAASRAATTRRERRPFAQ